MKNTSKDLTMYLFQKLKFPKIDLLTSGCGLSEFVYSNLLTRVNLVAINSYELK